MAYESVLWTAKTPITADRLAKMQSNIDELRAMLEGNQQYISGAPMGAGKGILHLQEITAQVSVPTDQFVQIGNSFTPKTEAGRRYLFEFYAPRVHSYSGGIGFWMYKDDQVINTVWAGMGTNAWEAYIHGFEAGFFANSVYGAYHVTPGYSITSSYSVKALAYLNSAPGLVVAAVDATPFIKFTDVGPALNSNV